MNADSASKGGQALLGVELSLPFRWERGAPEGRALDALLHGSRLLLNAVGIMEAQPPREAEAEKWAERLDAKMDLILHLLAMSLTRDRPPPAPTALRLTAEGASWPEAGTPPAPGEALVLALHIAALPLPLRLPARVTGVEGGRVEVRFTNLGEDIGDAWQQWLFRQHRRAVHAARERP